MLQRINTKFCSFRTTHTFIYLAALPRSWYCKKYGQSVLCSEKSFHILFFNFVKFIRDNLRDTQSSKNKNVKMLLDGLWEPLSVSHQSLKCQFQKLFRIFRFNYFFVHFVKALMHVSKIIYRLNVKLKY